MAKEIIHIGKSSGGWCFSLHILPDFGIHDLPDWEPMIRDHENKILNEYEEEIKPDDMMAVITNRGRKCDWTDAPYGYESWEQFHKQNHSAAGPNGLLRHRIDGHHCTKHGAGTWDCLPGDFS